MAGKRLTGTGRSSHGYQYYVDIYDADFSGTAYNFDIEYQGISINWDNDGQGADNRHAPIFGSKSEINMLVPVDDTTLNTFLEDLRLSKEGRFTIEIKSVISGTTAVVWRGIVVADSCYETDEATRFRAKITAVCGLALLKKVPYYNAGTLYTGSELLIRHLIKALSKLSHTTSFWGTTDPFIRTSVDWWASGMSSGDDDDPFNQAKVGHEAFYDFKTKGGVDKDCLSCYQVIRNIMVAFGSRIYQFGGIWVVEQIPYRVNSTYMSRIYDRSNNFIESEGITGVNTINQTEFGSKISFVTYDYLPQLGKAQLTYEIRKQRNFWGNFILSEGVQFNFNQDIEAQDTKFRIRGNVFLSIKNNTYSGQTSDQILAELRLEVKLGDNYLKRVATFNNFGGHLSVPEWTTSSGDTVAILSNTVSIPPTGITASLYAPFDFITPVLPSNAQANRVSLSFFQLKKNNGNDVTESEFTITWFAQGMYMETFIQGTPDVAEDEVLYETLNPDEGTEVWEDTTRIGGVGDYNALGRLLGTSNTLLDNWGEGVGTRNKPLGQLVTQSVMNGQLRPTKRLSGDLLGPLAPMKLIRTSDLIDWLPMQITWYPDVEILSGSWVEMDYGTAGVNSTPVKVKILLGDGKQPTTSFPVTPVPTGDGNQGFNFNSPPTVLAPVAANSISAQILKGDSVTSFGVERPLDGDEFTVGDTITLMHPIRGTFQEFEVQTAPGVGDTSIDVVTATAEFDSPVGSYLLLRQKSRVYTDELAQEAVGNIFVDSAEIDFTYDTVAPSITAVLKVTGVTPGSYNTFTVDSKGRITAAAVAAYLTSITLSGDVTGTGGPSVTTTIANNAVTTSKIQDDAVTLLKLQNAVATNIFLGNIAGAGQPYVELTATQATAMLNVFTNLLKGLVPASGGGTTNFLRADGTWAAPAGGITGALTDGRVTLSAGPAAVTDSDKLIFDRTNNRLTLTGTVSGTGNAWLKIAGAAIGASTDLASFIASVAGTLGIVIQNARNSAGTDHAKLDIRVGGTSAGDPFILFGFVTGGVNYALGVDNSAVGDPLRLTPGGTQPGSTANKGVTVTSDAATRVGINIDAPKHELDVDGGTRSDLFINTGNLWGSGNIAIGAGSGSGVFSSASGGGNWFQITWTVAGTPTNNGDAIIVAYPIVFPSAVTYPVFSARSETSAADLTKYWISNADGAGFTLKARGTLTVGTHSLNFCTGGYNT